METSPQMFRMESKPDETNAQMDRLQDFAGCLYDSSDESTEGTFISKPERDSQRLRRSSRHPIQMPLEESDDSNIGSEDEYIPCPKDESTESDSSLELTLEDKKKGKKLHLGRAEDSLSVRASLSPGRVDVSPPNRKEAGCPVRASLTLARRDPLKQVMTPHKYFRIAELMGMKRK
ncbi:hypothetical protein JOB18_032132 [Solea senegalensis]|uniref:Uncharacterized protein n=1 Tax=Solea senegalensis TaxID=28829 RepID=A0AAV6T8K1_SOLSE|nr:hypothetical protein JOB18_032132 [Solea senegalensis]